MHGGRRGDAWQGMCMAGDLVWQGGTSSRYYEILSKIGGTHPTGIGHIYKCE